MIRDLDFSNLGQSFVVLLMRLVIVFIALSFHETAHGFVAYKLGDDTAKSRGRISMSPLAHLDPVGFVCMLLFGFGWARPVPIDARRFKKPKRDMALCGLAGPVSNLILAFVILIPYAVMLALLNNGVVTINSQFGYGLYVAIVNFVYMFHFMNLTLAVFNFIPVPPLDGSRLLWALLPDKLYFGVMRYERYISLAIMLMLVLGFLDKPLMFVSDAISSGMLWLISLLPFV